MQTPSSESLMLAREVLRYHSTFSFREQEMLQNVAEYLRLKACREKTKAERAKKSGSGLPEENLP